jgi:hypothetical protein
MLLFCYGIAHVKSEIDGSVFWTVINFSRQRAQTYMYLTSSIPPQLRKGKKKMFGDKSSHFVKGLLVYLFSIFLVDNFV